jgi:hypothetical protein
MALKLPRKDRCILLPNLTAESLFDIHPRIISAQLATVKGEVLFSKTREGYPDPLPREQSTLLKLRAEFFTEISRRSKSEAENVKYVLTSYGNRYGLLIPRGTKYVALVLDKSSKTEELSEIIAATQNLEF